MRLDEAEERDAGRGPAVSAQHNTLGINDFGNSIAGNWMVLSKSLRGQLFFHHRRQSPSPHVASPLASSSQGNVVNEETSMLKI